VQVIGSTFNAYAGPFRSLGIYNPLANIYAGLNYAIHRYDGYWTSVLGQGHGYDRGGLLRPGWSLAYNGTGRSERVLGPGEAQVVNNFYINVAETVHPAEVGRKIVTYIRQFEKRSGSSWRS
jgi:SLT domain-containing protein